MIIISVIIIIVVLVWGKISIDALENHPRASLLKTSIYFFLSCIVCFIYYKSSIVETNTNIVDIYKLKGVVDDKGENLDKTDIYIRHRMHIYKMGDFLRTYDYIGKGGFSARVYPSKLSNITQYDTTYLADIYNLFCGYRHVENKVSRNNPDTVLCKRFLRRLDQEYDVLRPEFKSVVKRVIDNKEKMTHDDSLCLNDALDYILKDIVHLYTIHYIASKNASFLPYETYCVDSAEYLKTPSSLLCLYQRIRLNSVEHEQWGTLSDNMFLKELNVKNAAVDIFNVAETKITSKEELPSFEVLNRDTLSNYIDYFTASDMSQRKYEVYVNSDIPLRVLHIVFDEPINLSNIYPMPDTITAYSIMYVDSAKLEYIRNSPIFYHVKYPTYENKQLIRSLVLTTILVGVVSLFCIHFFILLKSGVLFLNLRFLSSNRKKLLLYMANIMKWLILVLSVCVFTMYLLYALGKPIDISEQTESNIIDITLYAVICIVVLFFLACIIALKRGKKN